MKTNNFDLKNKVNELEKRVAELEKVIKKLTPDNPSFRGIKSIESKKNINTKPNEHKKEKRIPPKIECIVNESLQAVSKEDKDLVFTLKEEDIINNSLVFGDDLIVETHKDGNIKQVKVARRAKRNIVEALVTQKEENFYAVSQYATHILLDHDVKTKGVLKGFEVMLVLPAGNEDKAKVAIIKEIESTVKHAVPLKNNIDESLENPISDKPASYDPRIVEEDDLV